MLSPRPDPGAVSRGVTMIELVIVLAITAMLLLAVGPDIAAWLRNTRIRNAAESAHGGMQRARSEAMRRNQTVRFTLVDEMSNRCAAAPSAILWVVSLDDPAGHCADAASLDTQPRIVATSSALANTARVVVSATQPSGTSAHSISFDGFGRAAQSGSISRIVFDGTAGDGSRSLHLMINSAGSIRLCDPHVAADDPRHC
jgi:type IV fimbrial biogenesis protein FimT